MKTAHSSSDQEKPAFSNWQIKLLEDAIGNSLDLRKQTEIHIQTSERDVDASDLIPLRCVWFASLLASAVLFISSVFVAADNELRFLAVGFLLLSTFVLGRISKRTWCRCLAATLKEWSIRPHRCIECGYDLKGTISDQCPECGSGIAVEEQPPTHLKSSDSKSFI